MGAARPAKGSQSGSTRDDAAELVRRPAPTLTAIREVSEEALRGELFVNARHGLPATWRLAVSDNGKKTRYRKVTDCAEILASIQRYCVDLVAILCVCRSPFEELPISLRLSVWLPILECRSRHAAFWLPFSASLVPSLLFR